MKKVKIFVAAMMAVMAILSFAACGDKCANGHSYGEWTVTVAATCTEDGTETRKCSVCDKEETRPIAKLGHNYGDPVYAERDGKLVTVSKCSRCDVEDVKEVENGVAVRTWDELATAVKTNNAYIVLMNDIAKAGATDFNIRPDGSDLNLTINLNGKTIGAEVNTCTAWNVGGKLVDCGYKLTVKILNGTIGTENGYIPGEKIAENRIYYGVLLNGVGVDLTVENATLLGYYGGFYTNGSNAGSTVSISDCTIKGAGTENGNEPGASYLAGGHTVTFDRCTFEGGFGLYIKSGNVTLNDCAVRATGAYEQPNYNGNGADGGGSGIVVDSVKGYNIESLTFVMNGGSISSANGYAFEQVVTKGENYSNSTLNGVNMTAGKEPKVFVTTEGSVTVK